jgi:undecaprenyl diphosphate synthase
MSDEQKKLEHLAIIIDGNGRWAQALGMPRKAGHVEGVKAVEIAMDAFQKMGGKYLTLFCFSTENWNRPQDEVDQLMMLFENHMKKNLQKMVDNGIRFRVFGDKTRFKKNLQEMIEKSELETAHNNKFYFSMCLNYGGRLDILQAVKKIAADVRDGYKSVDEITFSDVDNALYTAGIPDPDMIVRTSGENRISNFLLWQMAYSEFYFPTYNWPDFNEDKMKEVFEEYAKRNRRYGAIKEEK